MWPFRKPAPHPVNEELVQAIMPILVKLRKMEEDAKALRAKATAEALAGSGESAHRLMQVAESIDELRAKQLRAVRPDWAHLSERTLKYAVSYNEAMRRLGVE